MDWLVYNGFIQILKKDVLLLWSWKHSKLHFRTLYQFLRAFYSWALHVESIWCEWSWFCNNWNVCCNLLGTMVKRRASYYLHDWYCSVSNMSNHFWLKFLYDTYDGSYRYHANVIEKKHRIVGGAEMIILQQIITIALCIFGTMLTRFCRLSFLV